jgi:hypothetical protein
MAMTFHVALVHPPGLRQLEETDEQAEGFISLIIDACALLAETDCRFVVSGFGDDAWPVDVDYDLSTVIQQLPDLLASLRAGEDANLDLFEQGIQRLLEFSSTRPRVEIRCYSGTEWKPEPAIEHAGISELEEMFIRLAVDFAKAVSDVSAGLAHTPPIPAWSRGEV